MHPRVRTKHQTLPGLNISPLPLRFNHMLSRPPLSPPTALFPVTATNVRRPWAIRPMGIPYKSVSGFRYDAPGHCARSQKAPDKFDAERVCVARMQTIFSLLFPFTGPFDE